MKNKFFIHTYDIDEEYEIEWIHENIRFAIWLEDYTAGWYYVDNDKVQDCGNIDISILKEIYKKIGKILENEGKEIE